MLDTAATLDPNFTAVYSYGATVLPAINVDEAIKLLEKGIAAQPDNWLLYHQLGYIYWKNKDYQKAGGTYDKGATKPNAPVWMRQMSAYMQAQGGSRETARAMYGQMYETAQDGQMRELALKRLSQIDSFEERDAIRTALQNFQTKNNQCPNGWREVIPLLRAAKLPNGNNLRFDSSGSPIDPSGAPYLLINKDNKCDVDLDWKISKILNS